MTGHTLIPSTTVMPFSIGETLFVTAPNDVALVATKTAVVTSAALSRTSSWFAFLGATGTPPVPCLRKPFRILLFCHIHGLDS